LLAGGQAVVRHPEVVAGCGFTPVVDGIEALVDALATASGTGG
jgi:hypothetical protein